jgi:hypothetical protein
MLFGWKEIAAALLFYSVDICMLEQRETLTGVD